MNDRARLPLPATVGAGALILFAALGVAVRLGWTQGWDTRLIGLFRGLGGSGALRDGVIDLTALGSGVVLLLAILATSLLLAVRKRGRLALRLLCVVLGGRIVVELVKDLVERARPPLAGQAVAVHSWSFPSAHAANTTITCLALALAAGGPDARARRATVGLAAGLALAIGITRVWLGVHWPSDVLAGWLFGLGWTSLWSGTLEPARAQVAPA